MRQNQAGFTLVELVITLMVVATAFVLLSSAYATATRLADRNDDMLEVNAVAYEVLQRYENRLFDDLVGDETDEDDPSTTYTDFSDDIPTSVAGPTSGRIYIKSITPSLKYLFVRVNYSSSTGDQVLEYGTMAQRGGLGR